ncbi:MAG: site-specific DNA-methyltransferase [Gammaproteobacteria bacterium]|nr:site-specific DNA-methyltransferase [Gammaproteobacteria bacterium]
MPILHWLDRDKSLAVSKNVPYRLLEEDKQYSYGDNTTNMIIQGDNLEALKALLPYYAGQVKCIYIDPPYNTKSAFEHYDDNMEHSQWLNMMYPRLELLWEFLREDGTIWVSIDDNEGHYLKVIMDEVFGRKNFVANVVWQKKFSPQNDEKLISENHDHIIVFAKNKNVCQFNQLVRSESQNNSFRNPDNDPRGPWSSGDMTSKTKAQGHSYPVISPAGVTHYPPSGRQWAPSEDTFIKWVSENRIWFGKDGKNKPRIKQFLCEIQKGIVPLTIWLREDVGDNQDAKREVKSINPSEIFETPKPESLIHRVITLATNPNDIVLDSFLGSGTTAAVAHKTGRVYIGIEMGDHAVTHVVPRLKKVIEGEQGGISKSVNWQGGGGFCFYRLGETIFDAEGHLNPSVKFHTLASHIWFTETRTPFSGQTNSPLLGIHKGVAYYLLYNGILGDRCPHGGNVLTHKVLTDIPPYNGEKVIFGEATRIGEARLRELGITFKQTPYDLKLR